MSGHSKWAQIKRKKAVVDQKRGAIFSRYAKEIAMAARHGGGNLDGNIRLRAVIDRAKAVSMPNENIDRAILRGTGQLPGVVYEEVTYEGYGPGGIAVIAECFTDNRNRTTAALRHAFTKSGGALGETGSVGWIFDRVGLVTVDRTAHPDEEKVLEAALEAGAEDVETEEDQYQIRTDPGGLDAVSKGLAAAGIKIASAALTLLPKTWVTPDSPAMTRAGMRLIETLEEDDDVQNVHSNLEPPQEMAEE
jgi:YebC/PmpR family DNA-binding regulatory protein